MVRYAALALALLAALALPAGAVGPSMAAPAPDAAPNDVPVFDGEPTSDSTALGGDATNNSTAPGEHLAGAVGAHRESVDRSIATLTLQERLSAAETAADRAAILESACGDLSARLDALENRVEGLDREFDDGELTRGELRAHATRIDARTVTVADRALVCLGYASSHDGINETRLGAIVVEAGDFREAHIGEYSLNATPIPERIDDLDDWPDDVDDLNATLDGEWPEADAPEWPNGTSNGSTINDMINGSTVNDTINDPTVNDTINGSTIDESEWANDTEPINGTDPESTDGIGWSDGIGNWSGSDWFDDRRHEDLVVRAVTLAFDRNGTGRERASAAGASA